ncbi:MAG: glycosyltransferase [Bacteroidales bacterium]|jgi:glycosyltransferase involved in cell wall biosynthesis|nr:glycosyltransferase [Bacteroidales bacterium]
MSYLLSIVVPTKNRYKYLKVLIKLIDSFKSNEIELIIHDNSDNNFEIIDYINSFNNNNIKYFHSNEKLTMISNSDLAISKSTAEYVCFIGDDDGVTRNILDCVKWMKSNNVDSIFSNCAYYNWSGTAQFFKRKNNIIKHDTSIELNVLLRKGMILNESHLPLLYHAIVKREVLNTIYKKYETHFLSTPPDISSAVLLAFEVNKYYEINIPIIINGTSEMTGGGVIRKGGVIRLDDVDFINDNDRKEWENFIPPIWCGSYAWANSGIKTLQKNGKESYINKFDIDYNLAHAFSLRPKKIVLFIYALKYKKSLIRLFYYIFLLLTKRLLRKFISKLNKNIIIQRNLHSIIEAEEFFYLNSINSQNLN